jgi:hypothetical protein
MPFNSESVTMKEVTSGGSPYKDVDSINIKRDDTSKNPIKSVLVTTISGRKVYVPVKR